MRASLQLDGHKLLYHLDELNAWVHGRKFYPIYVELSPTSACNQKCMHCYIRYLGPGNLFLEEEVMLKLARQLGKIGVKALCIAGTGEPFLHKSTPKVIHAAKLSGLDVACATNGILLSRGIAEKVLPDLTWVRFSILGGSKNTYKKFQGAKENDWDKLIQNLQDSVTIKKKHNLKVTLGVVFFVLQGNGHEVISATRMMKEIGVDYMVIKPVGDYKKNNYTADKNLDKLYLKELKRAEKLIFPDFKVQVRWDMFQEWGVKPYKKCLSLPFMTVIGADGGVYACGGYWQDERYLYGNLYTHSFKEIWDSQRRRDIMRDIEENLNFKECYNCCRNHTINQFLWQLKQPPEHVNFI